MKKISLCLAIVLSVSLAFTQPPPGYYDAASGLYGVALQNALHNIIKNHTTVSYDDLYTHFAVSDIKPNNTVWDMYSDNPGGTSPYAYQYISSDECGSYNGEGDCFNREHSWPKSWFGGTIMPMYSDMFHLYPTDGYVNNMRNNYPYGEVSSSNWTSQNGSKLGDCSWPGYTGTVFEPIDDYKGDFARSYFYMSTRYYTEDGSWPGSDMTNGAQLKPWARSMMLQWSAQDPVSQKEIDRNNTIYLIQHNRNPFIDNPQWAFSIWSPGAGIEESQQSITLRVFPNPVKDFCHVLLPSDDQKWSVKLIASNGDELLPKSDVEKSEMNIDVQNLAAGTYFLVITNSQTNSTCHALLIHQ